MLANFSNLITFSRGSNATVTDASGRLTYAPHNLLTNSETFENAAWTKGGVTVTANTAVAPDGTTTADKLVENTSTSSHNASQTVTIVSGAIYANSVYAKADGRNWVCLEGGSGAGGYSVWFNLATGAVGTISGTTASNVFISDAGNGWYRCSVLDTTTSTTGVYRIFVCDADNNQSYTGDGTSGIFIWGAQLEAVTYQTTPSPYVSTSVANLLGFSEDFTNAAWAKSNTAIVPGAAQNPINNLWNAQKLMEDTATAGHFVNQLVTTVAGVSYTASVYLKAAGRNARLFVYQSASPFTTIGSVTVDLSNGAVLSGAGSVTSVGNGWYRVSVTGAAIDTATRVRVDLAQGVTFSYTGDGNSGIYIYGAQLSNSGSLDPYVPTPGAAPSSTAYYGPRFDYDPVTLAAKGILIEEQRTNLFTRSEEFDNGAWVKNNATITANAIVAPDGTTTADKIIPSNGLTGYVYRNTGISSGSAAFSIYVKAAEWGFVRVVFGGSFSPSNATYIRLSDGAVTAGSGFTAQSVGNGWFRITGSSTYSTATDNTIYVIPTNSGTSETTGNGTSGIYVWGGQMEAGAFATSYIPTVASQVTRSADQASINGSLFSQWFNQNEGAFVSQFSSIGYTANSMLLAATDGTTNNIAMQYLSFPTDLRFTVRNATVDQCLIDGSFNSAGINRMASSYATNNFNSVTNGGAVVSDPSGTPPTLNTLGIGNRIGSLNWNGHIRSIQYIPNTISNTQLQSLSAS